MKVGMETDRVEEIDRELERAIAAAAEAFFASGVQTGDIDQVGRLSQERVALTEPHFVERLVA